VTYLPLPKSVTIRDSGIHGLGLFAVEDIAFNECLGKSHFTYGIDCSLERTPLGAFYNHSETPNCIKKGNPGSYFLHTLRDVTAGEELTVKYTFYKLELDNHL